MSRIHSPSGILPLRLGLAYNSKINFELITQIDLEPITHIYTKYARFYNMIIEDTNSSEVNILIDFNKQIEHKINSLTFIRSSGQF